MLCFILQWHASTNIAIWSGPKNPSGINLFDLFSKCSLSQPLFWIILKCSALSHWIQIEFVLRLVSITAMRLLLKLVTSLKCLILLVPGGSSTCLSSLVFWLLIWCYVLFIIFPYSFQQSHLVVDNKYINSTFIVHLKCFSLGKPSVYLLGACSQERKQKVNICNIGW